jgi:hypothetical protein
MPHAHDQHHANWIRYTCALVAGSVAWLIAMVALVLAVDPWKALPHSLPLDRPMTATNQRLLFPMLLRTRSFDSYIFGNSTGMLIDPAELGRRLDGRFINLALGDGRAWEQLEVLRYVLSLDASPRMLVFAMDWVWCEPTVVRDEHEIRRFPNWTYAPPSWSNVWRMLNDHALIHALRVLGFHLGAYTPRIRADGYFAFTPPDARYDPAAAKLAIYGAPGRSLPPPLDPPERVASGAVAGWTFPALDRLQALLAPLPNATRVVFATMPVHAAAQPRPGSAQAQREEACKIAMARIAARHGSALLDFRIHSPVTRTDANYWDPLHYRVSIARRLEQAILTAYTTLRSDPEGFWRVIDRR